MWNWVKNAIGLGDAAEKVMEGLDDLFTSDEERLKVKERIQIKLQELARMEQEDVNKRHQYDMQSDSWLSKNVRPLTLCTVLSLSIFIVVASFFPQLVVNPIVLEITKMWAIPAITFYFGGRTLEKAMKMWKSK